MAFDWKGLVGTVAPAIAGTFGTPLAGLGVAALCKALGLEYKADSPEETEAMLVHKLQAATPDMLITLRKEDNAFKLAMRQADVDLERVHASDRDSARSRQASMKDHFPAFLCSLLTMMFGGVLAAHIWVEIPVANATQMNVMLGSLGTAWLASVYYYYGTTTGSKSKDATMAQAFTAK